MSLSRWAILLFVVGVYSSIFPSIRVNSCDTASETCELSVILLVTIDKEGSSWGAEVIFDEEIQDSKGRKFRPASPVTLSFQKTGQQTRKAVLTYLSAPNSLVYPLQWKRSHRNAYEQTRARQQGQMCQAANNEICCTTSYRSLAFNDTTYEEFTVLNPHTKFSIIIHASQADDSFDLVLTQDHRQDSLPGIKVSEQGNFSKPRFNIQASLVISAVQNPPAVISSRFMIPTSYPESLGFLVPAYFFGSNTNQIGISENAWALNANCNYPLGYLVAVNGGSIYDQFSTFRGTTMEDYMPRCIWNDSWSTAREGSAVQGFDCDMQQTEILSVEIASTNLRLIKLYADPYITDQGTLPLHNGDEYLYLFVDIMNIGMYGSVVTLSLSHCDPIMEEVQASIEHWIDPHETERFQFRIRSENIEGTSGECTVNVIQHGAVSIQTVVSFAAISIHVPSLQLISYTDDDDCSPPSQIVTMQGKLYCQHPCSIDEQIQTNEQFCTPVNCHEKYAGGKDFFNFESNLCEPVTICQKDEELNVSTNHCEPKEISFSTPSPSVSLAPNVSATGPPLNPIQPVNQVIDCGIHGEAVEGGISCRCDAGWVSDPNQDIFSFRWCTVPYQPPPSGNHTVGGEQPNGAPSGLVGWFKSPLFIASVCLVILIFALIIKCFFLFKCRKNIMKSISLFSTSSPQATLNTREGINPYTNYSLARV